MRIAVYISSSVIQTCIEGLNNMAIVVIMGSRQIQYGTH